MLTNLSQETYSKNAVNSLYKLAIIQSSKPDVLKFDIKVYSYFKEKVIEVINKNLLSPDITDM